MAAVALILYIVVPLVSASVLYFVLRKAIAHGIGDARRAAVREGLAPGRVDVP